MVYGSEIEKALPSSPRPPLRVLAVMPGLTSDAGAERSLAALAPALLDSGVQLHLALLTDRQTLVPRLRELGVVVHDLSPSKGLLGRVRALKRTAETISPALIHATLFEASQAAQLASLFTPRSERTPLLITWANTVYSPDASHGVRWGKAKYEVLRWWEVYLARATHSRYHAVTQGVADFNAPRLRVDAERIRVGERGRDGAAMRAEVKAPDGLRRDLGLAQDSRLVLTVGRQDHQKAHEALVRTFDHYAADHPDDRLVIAGRPGTGTAELNCALQTLQNPNCVVALGHRDDIPTLLAAADVVVCSSLREGAAGVLLEAMAMGTPVISVPLDGLRGVLIDGENARVAPLERFPEVLEEVFANPEDTRRMTTMAQREADHRFSIGRSAARLVDLYHWAAGVG